MSTLKPFSGDLDEPTSPATSSGLQPFTGTLDGEKPKRSLIDAIKPADKAIAFGAGALQGVKMISDAFGAGNAVSQKLGDGVQALQDRVSDERKAEKQQRAQIIKAAEDSGST